MTTTRDQVAARAADRAAHRATLATAVERAAARLDQVEVMCAATPNLESARSAIAQARRDLAAARQAHRSMHVDPG